MDVRELSRDQLDELKESLFWEICNLTDTEKALAAIDPLAPYTQETLPDYPHDIPDAMIFQVYAAISFVNDDFCCTAGR